MSTNESSPNIETNETNAQNNLSTESGYPNMSTGKIFIVQNGLLVEGDAVVTGNVTATSFIGDGSQLTGISGGGGGGLDSAAVTLLVDSDYVAARAPAGGGGLDSAGVQTLIDAEVQDPTTLTLGASSNAGIGIGSGVVTNGLSGGSVSIGTNANSYIQSVAIGSGADASGTGSVSVGPNTQSSGNFNTAIGREATTSGSNSLALGYSSSAGNYGIALGDAASGQRSIAVGALASAPATGALHINANYNSGVGPTADGGLVIETASARLEYSADSDWTFDATVNAPAFVGDGSGLTNLPSGGGGLDGFDVSTYDSATSNGIFSYNVSPGNQIRHLYSLNDAVAPTSYDGSVDYQVSWTMSSNQQFGFRDAGGFRTKVNALAKGSTASTGLVLEGETYNNSGVELVGNVKLSSLPTSDPSETGLLWNDGGIAVFSGSTAPTGGGGLDSAAVEAMIDSDLVGAESPNSYTMKIGANADRIAVGKNAVSDRVNSISIGTSAGRYIDGGSGHVVIGDNAGGAAPGGGGQAHNIIAIGTNASTDISSAQYETIAMGYNAGRTNMGHYAIAIGSGASMSDAGSESVALGASSNATGSRATAIGVSTDATGLFSVALGDEAQATARNAIAIGKEAFATSDYSVTIQTSAAGSLIYSTDSDWVFGATVTSPEFKFSDGTSMTTAPTGGGGLDSAGVQSIVDDNILGSLGDTGVTIGPGASAASDQLQQVVIGPTATSSGQFNVAIGRNAKVQSSRASGTAVGNDARVGSSQGGNNGVAIGVGAVVERDAGTSIGPYATTKNGSNGVAVGMQANAWGASALALGHGASATTSNTIAIGSNTNASTQYGIDIRTSAAGSLTYDTTNDWTFGAGVTMTDLTASGATVIFSNLPVIDPVNAGQLWNDNGTLKVSAG